MPNFQQIGGTHYDTAIQPLDYIAANKLSFAEGNIIKYVTRYKDKNGVEDLLKARSYLDWLIDQKSPKEPEVSMEIQLLRVLSEKITASGKFYSKIVTTGRGGMWAAANLGYMLGIDQVECLSMKAIEGLTVECILFVDDICDTGKTISKLHIDTAVLIDIHPNYVKGEKVWRPKYSGLVLEQEGYVEFPIGQVGDRDDYKKNI